MQEPRSTSDVAPEVDQLLYTPQEASTIVSLTPHWLVKNAREGRIPHHRVGRLYRFSLENLKAIKETTAQPVTAGQRPTEVG